MERSLLWVTLVLGVIGWLCSVLLTRARKSESSTGENALPSLWLGVSGGLSLLVFLATLPTKAPFAEGQGFGKGFLLGGLLSLLAAWTMASARFGGRTENASRPAAEIAAPFALSVVGATVPLLFMNATLIDSLLGVVIGWFCTAVVCFVGLSLAGQPGTNEALAEKRRSLAFALLAGVGFAVTVCITAALGKYRGTVAPASGDGMIAWSSPALLLTALVPLILLINALPAWVYARFATKLPLWTLFARAFGRFFPGDEAQNAAGNGLRLVLSALALLVLAKLITVKIVAQVGIFHVIVLGVVAALIAWWLMAKRDDENETSPFPLMGGNALGILVILAGTIVAFQMLAGLGIALFSIAAWLVGSVALASALEPKEGRLSPHTLNTPAITAASGLLTALLFTTVLGIYRVYVTRYSAEMRGMTLTDQYALFSFLIGALAPTALASFTLPIRNLTTGTGLFRLIVAGILTLLLPGILLLLWGAKCALALLIGTALAVAMLPGTGHRGLDTEHRAPNIEHLKTFLPALFALAIGLALAQWTNHILPHAEMTRDAKIGLLKWLAGGAFVLIVLADYGSRFGKRQGETTGAATQGAAK
jgi:hypothetical protein